MRSAVAIWIFPIGSALVGCGHTETHDAILRAPEAKSSGPIELYMADQAPPQRPHYEIALVQAIGFGSDANPEDVAQALTEKAARLGCDAVVRTQIDVGYTRAHGAGVCVKWSGPGPAGPAPILPPSGPKKAPPIRPSPSPKMEPLPSTGPGQGTNR